jgi:DNA-binding LacI/PurR family transcriptional regulator
VPDRHLTTVRFDNKRVGMWAVDKIAGAEGGASGVEHMLIPGMLVEGDTVRDLR